MAKHIGILTAGGDSPGLNAAIRGVGKTAIGEYDMNLIGFRDGFRGLLENRFIRLNSPALSGILTIGGTILGTSRTNPLKDKAQMAKIHETVEKHEIEAVIAAGGDDTLSVCLALN